MADDVKITWGKPTELTDGTGRWQVRVQICNLTSGTIKILVADNPWKGVPDPKRPYAEKLYTGTVDPKKGVPTKETTVKKAKQNGKRMMLKAKGQKDDCRSVIFTYPWKPYAAYTDVFIIGPGGTIPKDPAKGGAGMTKFSYEQSVGVAPGTIKPYYATVISLPYPASVESGTDGPIRVAIDRVEGLPEQLSLVGTLPALGEPVELFPGDRVSEAAVLLRQEAPLEQDVIYPITVVEKVVGPEEVTHWPERYASFDIVGAGDPSVTEEPAP